MNIIIDGKQIEVEGKKTILQVAKENDVYIPSLCDHPGLSPFAGCRLCLVKIKGRKGYSPSCTTYTQEGMVVKTKSPQLQKLRRQILEFILTEHPNACLVCKEKESCDEYKSTIRKVGEVTGCVLCPNNGRCELQDVVENLNLKTVSFPSRYRNIEIKKDDPFFDKNYNLCILCGRCVRVCHEVRGASVLSFGYRGTKTVVGTVLDRPHREVGCQFCGACVDVCPTGALNERELKYELLPDSSEKTICGLCAMGCSLCLNLRKGRILNSYPSEEGEVNQGQACVKGRFLIRDLSYSSQRLLRPMIRRSNTLEEVEWEEALDYVAQRLSEYKQDEVAVVSSTQLTCEDSFLVYKLAQKVLKTENIGGPVSFSPFLSFQNLMESHGFNRSLNFTLDQISKAKSIFLVGTDVTSTHPMVWLKILKAIQDGAKFLYLSPVEFSFHRHAHLWINPRPGSEFYVLSLLSSLVLEENKDEKNISKIRGYSSFVRSLKEISLSSCKEKVEVSKNQLEQAALILKDGNPAVFLFGGAFAQVPWREKNLASLWNLSLLTGAYVYPLDLDSNSRGTIEIQRSFLGKKKNMSGIFQKISSNRIKALYRLGPVPLPQEFKPEFTVVEDSFINGENQKADVLLPATTFLETEGTFINNQGRVQKLNKAIKPLEEVKPDWWIVSQIAQRLGADNFNYKRVSSVWKELSEKVPGWKVKYYSDLKKKEIFLKEEEKGEKKFIPFQFNGLPQETSEEYPYLMMVEYNSDYYRSFYLSKGIKGFKVIRNSRWIFISPQDAQELGLEDHQPVEVKSSKGSIFRQVKISSFLPQGRVKTSFNWDEKAEVLIDFESSTTPSLVLLPVNIKRGK